MMFKIISGMAPTYLQDIFPSNSGRSVYNPKINFDELQSTSILRLAILYFFLKIPVLSCFVGSFNQFYLVFGGIWQYTCKVEIRRYKCL